MFQAEFCTDKHNTRVKYSNSPHPHPHPHPENRVVYEVMWKNIVQPDRPQITTWRMCIAYWIPKATNTHSQSQ